MADILESATSYTQAVLNSLPNGAGNLTIADAFPPTLVVFWETCTSPAPLGNATEFVLGWTCSFLAGFVAIFKNHSARQSFSIISSITTSNMNLFTTGNKD